MIRIGNLRCRTLAIDALSLGRGTTAVIGPNGSGKTTLLKACAGILLPDAGSILIDGNEPRRTGIGWVNEFPDRNFLFDTPADEIASPLRFHHLPPGEIDDRLAEIREQFGLTAVANRPLKTLSGGEKVLVALAAAVITRPAVLILDECDSHLDGNTMKKVDRLLGDAHIPHILRSTQDMECAKDCDQVIFLEGGRVRLAGTPGEVFSGLKDTAFYPPSWKVPA